MRTLRGAARRFFTDRLSMFDFIVVCVDVSVNVAVMIWPVSLAAPVVLARVARILKVTRALRMMAMFPELNLMMRGLISCVIGGRSWRVW